ncbi:MAG: hypothetical protein WCB68_09060 [Pyrinomonadaceae bacterium]
MKPIRHLFAFLLFASIIISTGARAQDLQGPSWQVTQFDINATPSTADRVLTVRATLRAINVGRGAGSSLTVRINNKAEVKAASVGDATATFTVQPDRRVDLNQIRISLPSSVAPNATVSVAVEYRLPLTENTGLASISPLGVQFLPLSFWYPAPNTLFSARGADIAPFRLTVNGEGAISSGVAKSSGQQSVFEQTLNAQPFFLSGSWDEVSGAGEARGVSALLMKGASADERKQAEALVAYAGAARTFYSTLLGPPPDVPVRLVAVTRGAGFNDGGTILLDSASFRRTKIDSATALLIAESVARLWIGGEVVVRGEGGGVVREGLSRYLATLFLEKQFGAEAALAERLRERIAYAAVSKRDAPLSLTTPLDDTYYNSVSNKGAMIWRLAERTTGPGGLGPVIRELLQSKKGDRNGLTLATVRATLVERGGANMKTLLDYGLDKPTDADLLVGLPVQREGQWVTALRNLGSVDVTVPVVATTDRGERLTTEASVPARNFGEALFKTANKIVRVEIDPDKLYPQLDYSNDIAPRAQLTEEALADATRFLGAQDYAKAETTARQLLSVLPRLQEARIVLARALLAQNKSDEAEREFRAALDEKLPTPATLAWTSIGLGEISLRKGQTAEAARRFNEAVRADAEYASTLTARASRIKAEAGANSSPTVDESARAFLAQLDQTIRGGRRTELDALIVPGELAKFSSGVITSQPEIWQTRVLRTETLDANRLAADVSLNTKELGREQAGTAVFILTRVGGTWKLADIQFFEVR